MIALGSPGDLIILDTHSFQIQKRVFDAAWKVSFSPDNKYLIHSNWGAFKIRHADNLELIVRVNLSKRHNPDASEPNNLWTESFVFLKDQKTVIVGCNNSFIYFIDLSSNKEFKILQCFYGSGSLSLSQDENYLVSSGFHEYILWDLRTNKKVTFKKEHDKKGLIRYTAKFHPIRNMFVLTNEDKIRFFDIDVGDFIDEIKFKDCEHMAFSQDGKVLFVANRDEILVLNFTGRKILRRLQLQVIFPLATKDFHSIETLIVSPDAKKLYMVYGRYLIKVNIMSEKLINSYLHLNDLEGTNFTGAEGINGEMVDQLWKNGALVGLSKTSIAAKDHR